MNVSTTTSSTSSVSTVSSTQNQSKSNEASKTAEKSFDEEMKSTSQTEEAKEPANNQDKVNSEDSKSDKQEINKSEDKQLQNSNKSDELVNAEMISGTINFTDFKYHNESQNLLSENIQNLLNTRDVMSNINSASTFDYDVVNMSDSDANFFANLVQNTDMSMKSISEEITNAMGENSQNIQQNVKVSSVLMEKLADSLKNNQPFRINFDKDISVIIKVNKDGSIMANFIPGDKAVEQYLKNNIASLRQRFDDENLSYSELSYSSSDRHKQQQQRKKENDNE